MEKEISLIKWPVKTGNEVYYLISDAAINELKEIFDEENLTNCILEFPTKSSSKFPQKINDILLKKIFNQHSGTSLLVLSNEISSYKTLVL